jgi:YebC/PmpR family DNA-binding regulatory protein
MSGHNKWSKIKRQKGANDAKKGVVFTKIAKMIKIAARQNTDPNQNSALRMALEKAKEVNMPKDNIQRILDKADKVQGQVVMYEGFANDGVGLLIKTYTDNTNRTVGEIRHILSKYGGSLGTSGAVMWMFEEITPNTDYQIKIATNIDESARQKLSNIVEALEELEDVDNIWTSVHEL